MHDERDGEGGRILRKRATPLKKQCEKAGVLSELRKREHYDKPSVRRKKKMLAARKKAAKRTQLIGES